MTFCCATGYTQYPLLFKVNPTIIGWGWKVSVMMLASIHTRQVQVITLWLCLPKTQLNNQYKTGQSKQAGTVWQNSELND